MAVQVLVGANAQSDAQQFLSAVQTFTQEVNKVRSAGQKLASSSEWQGKSAQKFDADFQAFAKAAALMEQSLQKMATGAKTVITNIDNTDAQGAAQIGSFSG
ncbi:WXG100 family type VII secretion target [Streptomyces sp. NPDC003233]|jgi:WXG100 family type VII secretion target|uniref:WXG100 family type VII secretion target n=1 Tax=Streptomyces sp. NPDC007856 TaxID=3364781 RepID=UPI003692884E